MHYITCLLRHALVLTICQVAKFKFAIIFNGVICQIYPLYGMYSVHLYSLVIYYYCLIYNTWYADYYANQLLNFVEAVHSYCEGRRRIFSDNYFKSQDWNLKTMELAE